MELEHTKVHSCRALCLHPSRTYIYHLMKSIAHKRHFDSPISCLASEAFRISLYAFTTYASSQYSLGSGILVPLELQRRTEDMLLRSACLLLPGLRFFVES